MATGPHLSPRQSKFLRAVHVYGVIGSEDFVAVGLRGQAFERAKNFLLTNGLIDHSEWADCFVLSERGHRLCEERFPCASRKAA